MGTDNLVETSWLEQHLNDPELRIFDCTVKRWIDEDGVFCVERGDAEYEKGHIPGAAHLDLVQDLSDPESALRFALPTAERFAAAVSRQGVSNDSRVVLYGTREIHYVTRVWWMFRVFGFDNVTLLDGGWQAWSRENRPVSTDAPNHSRGAFTPRFKPEMVADQAAVVAAGENPGTCLINALAPELHSGKTHIHFGARDQTSRPGRIPGSVNVWVNDLIDPETNKFLPLHLLQAKFEEVGAIGGDEKAGGGIITY
ncbi:MAG: sulfurtransferase [SAR324 cluster bacterium]|nr:sulfurtransferase [SAR324 cluster bacterium]